jgi:flagellar FliL protein
MAKEKKEKAEGAEKPELTPEEAAAKAKKKKMLIIIIAGVVVTAGVGGGLAFFLSKGSDAPKETTVSAESAAPAEGEAAPGEKKEEPKKEETKDAGKDAAAKPAGDKKDDKNARPKLPENTDIGCTTPMKSFNLNLGNPLENRYIRLEIAIEHGCAEEEKNEVTERMPQLRDAVISVTSKKTREFLLSPDGKAQLTYEIRNQINQRMSRPIKDVYITDILIE